MKNPSGTKLEKIVFGMFDNMVKGVDTYVTKQGSTWLIFTEEKKWIVEFTNDKTLWFNYSSFQKELELIGKNSNEETNLIKKWFESRFLYIPKVEDTFEPFFNQDQYVENAIQNSVNKTKPKVGDTGSIINKVIEEG